MTVEQAVSYTHLDVYKRQAQGAVVHIEHTPPDDFFQAESIRLMLVDIVIQQSGNHIVSGSDAVSYTHLDVYKRQSLHRTASASTAGKCFWRRNTAWARAVD